jgi:transglutaminase-like putative cysteine protease
MRYALVHRTVYEYGDAVTVSHHAARLHPKTLPRQSCSGFSLEIIPEPAVRSVRVDYFGNEVCYFGIQQIHYRLEITAKSEVAVDDAPAISLENSPPWDEVVALFYDPVSPDVVAPYEFVFDSPYLRASMRLADYARQSFWPNTPLLVGVQDLNRRIHRDFTFDSVATTVATPLEEVLEKRRGVCQDFAHVAIASLRSIGLPARYVSGYLRTTPPAGQERLVGVDASHAWFSVYCPGMGWIDFDPTNDVLASSSHITLAYGRDFGDVSPVSGILTGGGQHEVKVGVDVRPLDEL